MSSTTALDSENGLRILRVVQSTYPEVVGGIGLHVHEMSKRQAELGHQVTVLTTDNGDRSLPRRERRDGYAVVRHREHARPLDNSIAPEVLWSLRAHVPDYDVVHVHSHLYFMSNLAAVYEAFADTPMVLTNHGLVSQTAPLPVQKVFLPTIGRFTFEAADRILCYTETDRDRLRSRGIDTEISVVHNGIDCSTFQPTGTDDRKQLLFVGRLKPGKGVHHLVRAFAGIASEYPEWRLQIVGQGPLEEQLIDRVTQLGLQHRVTFCGEVSNERMPDLYSQSGLFVLPSLNEGLPRTVLESMACETPVVTSSLPQLESVVDGAGETVESGDPDRLAATLSDLLADPSRRKKLGSRGRRKVLERYSWTDTVDQTVATYRDLIRAVGGQRSKSVEPTAVDDL